MPEFLEALPHTDISEIFPDVFFVQGTRVWDFQNLRWQFSRNMIIVRRGDELSLVNTVRLDDKGLAALDALGTVKNIVKIGSLHGIDDAFYQDRYGAKVWGLPGMPLENVTLDETLSADNLPFDDSSIFIFETTNTPECILFLNQNGGIALACDALQNWNEPDEFFSEESTQVMTGMGFFQKANCGPVWVQANEPDPSDFVRLKELKFDNALCGHGEPLVGGASGYYAETFKRMFDV